MDQVFALSADLELAFRVRSGESFDDLAELRGSTFQKVVLQGLDKAAFVIDGGAKKLLDGFLAEINAEEKGSLFATSARTVCQTLRSRKPGSDQQNLVRRLASWFVSASVYLAALEQIVSDEAVEERRAVLEERLRRPQLECLLGSLPINEVTGDLHSFLEESLGHLGSGAPIDQAKLERLTARVAHVLLDEGNPLRGEAYEQHIALMSVPRQRKLIPISLLLKSNGSGSLRLEEKKLEVCYLDRQSQTEPALGHFEVFFKVDGEYNTASRAGRIYARVKEVGGEALLINELDTRFQPFLSDNEKDLAFDAGFPSLLRAVARCDVSDRTFVIAHRAKGTSAISEFAKRHRVDAVSLEVLGAPLELSVMGENAGPTRQLSLGQTPAPHVHLHHHEEGSQYVEQQWNIGKAQGAIGPNAKITDSTLIQINEADQEQAKIDLRTLLDYLRSKSTEEQGDHSEEIASVEAAAAAADDGDSGRVVQLLRGGGRYVLDAARELSLELLVRLIEPS